LTQIKIANRLIGDGEPTYFIADIAANHDGDLDRAKKLILLAKKSGADAAKFQHFNAHKIVSKYGFETLDDKLSHQSNWEDSVYDVYQNASIPYEWTKSLSEYCTKIGIHFLSTPYDFDALNLLDNYVPAFKVGSGDITWLEFLTLVSQKKKPVILSTGASSMDEVLKAVEAIQKNNTNLVILQCNTNYTVNYDNFKYQQLKVISLFKSTFPESVIGLSDHTPGHATVLGAVALGAAVIEKHFTDDKSRKGPDHPFSMDPVDWTDMVSRTRELELALGSETKKIQENEKESIIVQRRCLRAALDLFKGDILTRDQIEILRPAPIDSLKPSILNKIIGKQVKYNMKKGEKITWSKLF
jgi:sialic acid synthase SpsE